MPIDFKKLQNSLEKYHSMTPEQMAQEQQEWLEKQEWYQYQKKVSKLLDFVRTNEASEFEIKFITSVHRQAVIHYKELSEKQKAKVDELFNRLIPKS